MGTDASKQGQANPSNLVAPTEGPRNPVARMIAAPLPFIGHLSVARQMQILGGTLLVMFALIGAAIFINEIRFASSKSYASANASISMNSQRLAKAAQLAITGSPKGFDQLRDASAQITTQVGVLMGNGAKTEIALPEWAQQVVPEMAGVAQQWADNESNALALGYMQQPLERFNNNLAAIRAADAPLVGLADRAHEQALKSRVSAAVLTDFAQLDLLAQRVAQRAGSLDKVASAGSQATERPLDQELTSLAATAGRLARVGATGDKELQSLTAGIPAQLERMQSVVKELVADAPAYADGKRVVGNLLRDTESLLQATQALSARQSEIEQSNSWLRAIFLLVLASAILIALMIKVFIADSMDRVRQTSRKLEEMKILGEVGQAVSASLDINHVLTTILTHAVKLGQADSGTLYRYDKASGIFSPDINVGLSDEFVANLRSANLVIGQGAVGKAAEARAAYQIADVEKDASYALRSVHRAVGFRAVLGVPLLHDDEIAGGIVIRRIQPGAFDQSVVSMLQTFTGQSVLAMRNAQMFDEIVQKGAQLEAASQMKSQFLANMSHELRTPLNAIIGVTEMLLEDMRDLNREDEIEPLERVLRAGKHLLDLINDILDLSKIEAGKMDLHPELFAIKPLLGDVDKTLDLLSKKNGNKVVLDCPADIGSMNADQMRVRQVLLNLASNANKFTQNGTVSVTARREVIAGVDWIDVSVADTGIGMSAEQLGRLFQDFVQADATTTRKYGGTGLGLAISRRLCQMMGGDIVVESEQGKGSTFRMRIPANGAQGVAPISIIPRPSNASKTTSPHSDESLILVIDDDESVLDITERFLVREGFKVVTANGGLEGLRLARELHPSAITLDVMMPEIDGWTVLAAIKSDPALVDIPVILMTIVDDRTRGYALGATDYLVKPVNRDKLKSVLNSVCGNGGRKALVIEDDDFMRGNLCQSLEHDGWTVAQAENGQVGLDRVTESKPDVILLDLSMPVMDGFEFVAALRAKPEWRDIPVVVVTAKDITAEERKQLNGHVERVMGKGTAELEELLSEIAVSLPAAISRHRSDKVV